MSDPTRLSKRLAEVLGCSRADAECYIEGGWVSVDGQVVESPQRMVTTERVELDPAATLEAPEPATVLLHKPVGFDAIGGRNPAAALVSPATRWAADASGLIVLTQDGRVWRRLTEDGDQIEQEFVVEVAGDIAPYGLRRLNHGLRFRGHELPPCKVSWQNEIRLRFAIKAVQPGQIRDMCAQVGLQVVAIRRIRIGKIPLAKMPVGEWRYLPAGERF
jgi:23S rRNA pseudouridine2604 synthase